MSEGERRYTLGGQAKAKYCFWYSSIYTMDGASRARSVHRLLHHTVGQDISTYLSDSCPEPKMQRFQISKQQLAIGCLGPAGIAKDGGWSTGI